MVDPGTMIALGSQFNSVVGQGLTSALMYNQQVRDAREAATTAYNRSVDMWNKTNEYNTPAAQMERLKAAGLNPNLVYGMGSSGTANSFTAQQSSTPKHQPVQIPDMLNTISQYQDTQIKKEQASFIAAQRENVEQKTKNLALDNMLDQLDMPYRETRNSINDVNLSNLEDYSADYLSGRNRAVALDNVLRVQKFINNDKNMDLLIKRYNLSEAQFTEFKRQFNEKMDLANRQLQTSIGQFDKRLTFDQKQADLNHYRWKVKNRLDESLYPEYNPDINSIDEASRQVIRYIDSVMKLGLGNLRF